MPIPEPGVGPRFPRNAGLSGEGRGDLLSNSAGLQIRLATRVAGVLHSRHRGYPDWSSRRRIAGRRRWPLAGGEEQGPRSRRGRDLHRARAGTRGLRGRRAGAEPSPRSRTHLQHDGALSLLRREQERLDSNGRDTRREARGRRTTATRVGGFDTFHQTSHRSILQSCVQSLRATSRRTAASDHAGRVAASLQVREHRRSSRI